MAIEARPGFLAWWSWRDGKTALRSIAFVTFILVLLGNELLPLKRVMPDAGVVERMVARALEFLVVTVLLMYTTWLVRRDRLTRDPAREQASS